MPPAKRSSWLSQHLRAQQKARRPKRGGASRFPPHYIALLEAVDAGNLPRVRDLLHDMGTLRRWGVERQHFLLYAATGQPSPRVLHLLLAAGLDARARHGTGWTPLIRAVHHGHEAVARALLQKGADPNAAGGGALPSVPLVLAAEHGRAGLVRLLLRHGADPNPSEGTWGRSPLAEAAHGGHAAALAALFAGGADPNARADDEEGRTPLAEATLARSNTSGEIVRLLLAAGARPDEKSGDGSTPLLLALQDRRGEAADALLAAGADVNVGDDAGWTPLVEAARSGMTAHVARLLERGADTRARDPWGWGALRWAAEVGHDEAIPLLLARETDFPALHRAVLLGGDANAPVRNLVAQGAGLDARDGDGLTALAWATLAGRGGVAQALLAAGADPNVSDTGGYTPLMHAAKRADENAGENVVRALIAGGADVRARRRDGWTALLVAASHGGSLPVVLALLDAGADIEARGRGGVSALTLAAAYGRAEIVRALLDRGTDVDASEEGGETALMNAAKYGYKEVIGLLLSRGADVNARARDDYTALRYADWWCPEPQGTAQLLKAAGATAGGRP